MLNLLHHCRVKQNSELKGENYGRNGSNGVCFWDGRSGRIHSFDKTNKDLKRKRNSRRELQGTVIHCSNSLSHGGIGQQGGGLSYENPIKYYFVTPNLICLYQRRSCQ